MAAAHVAQKVAGRIELPMPEISVQREKSFSGVAAGVVLRLSLKKNALIVF